MIFYKISQKLPPQIPAPSSFIVFLISYVDEKYRELKKKAA